MAATLSSFTPPDSLTLFVEAAVRHRRALLAYYLLLLLVVIPISAIVVGIVRLGSDYDIELLMIFLILLGILLFIQLISLYGGGVVGPPSIG